LSTQHFHAYAYTGKGYRESEVRAGLAPRNHPQPEVRNDSVEGGPRQQVAVLRSLDEAMEWLERELTTHDPIDSEHFPVARRLEYSRSTLQQTAANVVVYGYWARSQAYVARHLFPCELDTPACRA
jgi:hypothetical protein